MVLYGVRIVSTFKLLIHLCPLVVDCAEGTTRQFLYQPYGGPNVRASKVTKLFVTHMHGMVHFCADSIPLKPLLLADHVMGIITFLRSILHPPPVGHQPRGELPPPRMVCVIARALT